MQDDNIICEMYPSRTKTENVGDILSIVIEEFLADLPNIEAEHVLTDPRYYRGIEQEKK